MLSGAEFNSFLVFTPFFVFLEAENFALIIPFSLAKKDPGAFHIPIWGL